MSNPRAVVISGPSGVGKSTLIDALLARPGVRLAVSATTRDARDGEVNGVDYHFLTRDVFEAMRDDGDLLEWAEVHDRLYGTPRSELQREDADVLILDIDVQGLRSVRAVGVEVLSVFIAPPSLAELERRLRDRGTETEESLAVRLDNAAEEMAAQNEYDHVVVNDDVAQASKELSELVLRTPQGNGA